MAAAALGALLAGGARADERIRTQAGIGVTGKVTGVGPDGLIVEVARAKRSIAFADVARIESTDFPELKAAEAAYADGVAGNASALKEAEKLYRALLRKAPPWLRVLTQWRLYNVNVESGRAAEALDGYLEMAQSTPKLVTDLALPRPVEGDHDTNKAMLQKVEQALQKAADQPYADALRALRASLVMFEGEPAQAMAVLEELLQSRDPQVRRTAMFRRLELLLLTNQTAQAEEWFGRVRETAAGAGPGLLAYWHARVLDARGEAIPAALEYMRVPILYAAEDRSRTADALWRAGKALEAAQAPQEEVVKVYDEAARQYAGTPGGERARRELARLGAK